MIGRKTLNVKVFKDYVNKQLARTDEHATNDFKCGLCIALEEALRITGNYNGYSDLYWDEIGWKEWRTIGKETEVWEEKKLYIYGTPDSKYRGSIYARFYK